MYDYETYENLTRFRKPLIDKMIASLDIGPDSKGIDIGCGIGRITNMLSRKLGPNGQVNGLDLSQDAIHYAKRNSENSKVTFLQGDLCNLTLNSGSYDWIWSMDTVWVGSKVFGCPANEPGGILDQFCSLLKPGGRIYLSFWSSQKLLPGYPLLEARLNASESANAPYQDGLLPENHILFGQKWLRKAGFANVEAKSFLGDIVGPLCQEDKKAVAMLFQMLWGNSKKDVAEKDWEQYNELCPLSSEKLILNNPAYYGFYTYTFFTGINQR